MTEPTVSVVMLAYNAERFIREAIDSILSQTFTDFELLIIDDGSTDETPAILTGFARRDMRIRIHTQSRNLGIAAGRNLGLELAQGKYIAVMDADDISLPERLEKQVSYLESHPETGVLGAWAWIIDEHGQRQGALDYPSSPNLVRWALCFYDPLINPVVMFRAELARDAGGYRPEYPPTEDYDLWARLSFQTRLENLSEHLLQLRKHGQNVTITKRLHNLAMSSAVSRGMFKQMLGLDLPITPIELAWEPHRIPAADLKTLISAIVALRNYFFNSLDLTTAEKASIRRETALQLFRLVRNSASLKQSLSIFYSAMVADPLALPQALHLAFGRARRA